MKVLLLDAKEFSKVEGKIFLITNYYSFNMKKFTSHIFSKSWCPVSQFKVDEKGNVYGRIANELMPVGMYNNVIITTNDKILNNKYKKAMVK